MNNIPTPLTLTYISKLSNIPTEQVSNVGIIKVPTGDNEISFYSNRNSLLDISEYNIFIKNIIRQFRISKFYKSYKQYLFDIGLDKCQILGNVNKDMATIEMHHNFLTLFDLALLISEHLLNTIDTVSTFDVIYLLEKEHTNNRVPIVMLSNTPHDLYHNDPTFFIPPQSTFGKWWELLDNYKYGITLDIAYKIQNYAKQCINHNNEYSNYILELSNTIMQWSNYNTYNSL